MSFAELPARFWDKVNYSAPSPRHAPHLGNCWEWMASRSEDGYGWFWLDGKARKSHRLAYSNTYGDIEEGAEIDHRCHNPSCVHPAHLRAVTRLMNTQNRHVASRVSATGVRGVHFNKATGRYRAYAKLGGKERHLGYFDCIEEAEHVVSSFRREHYEGDLMWQNKLTGEDDEQ